jgi:hypothetical protein
LALEGIHDDSVYVIEEVKLDGCLLKDDAMQYLKKFTLFLIVLAFTLSCSKGELVPENERITKEEALELLESELKTYLAAFDVVLISEETVKPNTKLRYNESGIEIVAGQTDIYSGQFKSPGYESWLITVQDNMNYPRITSDHPHFFVHAKTGRYKKMMVGGCAIVKWDRNLSKNLEYWYPLGE